MFALDFVSLLLSKYAPRQAETSMSAFLKQVAPLGSLSAEVVNPPAKPEAATKDISTVSRGWRIQNFNSASAKLLDAASRLESEVTSEAQYWNEVLAVKEKGWKICRLPQNRQALGVQYGFLEATPIFRDRGLASLRRSENGHLVLDKGLIPSGSRFVRARVKQRNGISSSSRPSQSVPSDPGSVEFQILQARDSVFEEELFHELTREARTMASSGVTIHQDHIRVPASDDTEVLLDLVDASDDRLYTNEEADTSDHLLADGLAHSIRILLAFAHRQNLLRRTQVPSPLGGQKRPNLEYPLLRPALAYFQHLSHVRWLESFLRDIYTVLKSSGLQTSDFTMKTFVKESMGPATSPSQSLETFLQKSLQSVKSVFQGTLLNSGTFEVAIRTTLLAPPFGTAYNVSLTPTAFPDMKPPGILSLKDEVEAAITHIMLLDIVGSIASHRKLLGEDEKPIHSEGRSWEPIYPHLGELSLNQGPGKYQKLKISVSRRELSLSVYTIHSFDALGRGSEDPESDQSEVRVWTCCPSDGNVPQSSMMDFVFPGNL